MVGIILGLLHTGTNSTTTTITAHGTSVVMEMTRAQRHMDNNNNYYYYTANTTTAHRM